MHVATDYRMNANMYCNINQFPNTTIFQRVCFVELLFNSIVFMYHVYVMCLVFNVVNMWFTCMMHCVVFTTAAQHT